MNYLKILCCVDSQNGYEYQNKGQGSKSIDYDSVRNIVSSSNGARYTKKQKKMKDEPFKFYTNLIRIQKEKQIIIKYKQSPHFLLANIESHNFPLIENTKYRKRNTSKMKDANINVMEYSNCDKNGNSQSSESDEYMDDMIDQLCQHQICRKINTLSTNCQLFSIKAHKTDFKYNYQNTPEIIGNYVAQFMKKHNFQNVLDCFCGDGNNSIQMAQLGLNVLAIDSNYSRATLSKYNKKIYGICDKMRVKCIDFLSTDIKELFELKNKCYKSEDDVQTVQKFDCVLINPYYSKKTNNSNKQENFTLQNFNYDIVHTIQKSLEISENVLVLFPIYINIEEFDLIINKCIKKEERQQNYMIDIEILSINNFLIKIMVFFQKNRSESNNLSTKFMIQKLNEDNPYEQLSIDSLSFIKYTVQKYGAYQILQIIKDMENQKDNDLNLWKFIQILIDKRGLTEQELQEYFKLKNNKFDLNHYKNQIQKSEFSFQDHNQKDQSDLHDDKASATFHPPSQNYLQSTNVVLLKRNSANNPIQKSNYTDKKFQQSFGLIQEPDFINDFRQSFGGK